MTPLPPQEVHQRLKIAFGDAVSDLVAGGGTRDPFCKVEPARIVKVCRFLRDEPDLRFDFLCNLSGVDTKETLTTVYHLWSYAHRHLFVLKVEVPRERPEQPSVTGLWSTANWLERESYDLLGIVYTGHPDLRRIMMPDDWQGHPLRKDFQEKDAYRGMPTTRYSPLKLLPVYDAHAVEQLKEGGPGSAAPAGGAPGAPPGGGDGGG